MMNLQLEKLYDSLSGNCHLGKEKEIRIAKELSDFRQDWMFDMFAWIDTMTDESYTFAYSYEESTTEAIHELNDKVSSLKRLSKEVQEHYLNNDRLYFDRSENLQIINTYHRDGTINSYNVGHKGFYVFNGNDIRLRFSDKVVEVNL